MIVLKEVFGFVELGETIHFRQAPRCKLEAGAAAPQTGSEDQNKVVNCSRWPDLVDHLFLHNP